MLCRHRLNPRAHRQSKDRYRNRKRAVGIRGFMNVALLSAVGWFGLAASGPANMPAWVPREAMVAYWGRPPNQAPSTAPTGAQQMATWMVTLKAMGVIPREGRVLADIVGTLPLLGQ